MTRIRSPKHLKSRSDPSLERIHRKAMLVRIPLQSLQSLAAPCPDSIPSPVPHPYLFLGCELYQTTTGFCTLALLVVSTGSDVEFESIRERA